MHAVRVNGKAADRIASGHPWIFASDIVDRGKAAPGAKQKKPEKEEPFDLSGLKALNAAGTLKIGSLKANNVKASSVSAEMKAKDGHVDLNPLRADFYQGKLASAISVNAVPATPTFAVKHNMSGVNVGQLLKDLADADMLEDSTWVQVANFVGTRIPMKMADNGDFAKVAARLCLEPPSPLRESPERYWRFNIDEYEVAPQHCLYWWQWSSMSIFAWIAAKRSPSSAWSMRRRSVRTTAEQTRNERLAIRQLFFRSRLRRQYRRDLNRLQTCGDSRVTFRVLFTQTRVCKPRCFTSCKVIRHRHFDHGHFRIRD